MRLGSAAAFAALLANTAVAGDAARGERVFERCYACHSVDPAETELPGPNLAGVVGRRAARRDDFDYSPALREAGRRGLVWDEAALDAFLADPASAVPGTSMNFPGLRNEADRRDLIAYLKAAGP